MLYCVDCANVGNDPDARINLRNLSPPLCQGFKSSLFVLWREGETEILYGAAIALRLKFRSM